jgi:uncharacterized protein YfaS (alpha-2-macroglobulin family)
VSVRPDAPLCKGGTPVRISVKTESRGKPIPSEVEVSVVEQAAFASFPDDTVDVRKFFGPHPERILPAQIRDPAVLMDLPVLVPFETLHWGTVVTGEDGTAEVILSAPSRQATWRITARAYSGTDLFGESRAIFRTKP